MEQTVADLGTLTATPATRQVSPDRGFSAGDDRSGMTVHGPAGSSWLHGAG
jgi:hypothetical protein